MREIFPQFLILRTVLSDVLENQLYHSSRESMKSVSGRNDGGLQYDGCEWKKGVSLPGMHDAARSANHEEEKAVHNMRSVRDSTFRKRSRWNRRV